MFEVRATPSVKSWNPTGETSRNCDPIQVAHSARSDSGRALGFSEPLSRWQGCTPKIAAEPRPQSNLTGDR